MKNTMLNISRRLSPGCLPSGSDLSGFVRPYAKAFLAVTVLAVTFGMSRTARADDYNFSVNGSGIQASGILNVSNTGPLGASTVTGITGTFSDSTNGFSGAISGPEHAPAPILNPTPVNPGDPPANTFNAPAGTSAGFSYDNLFWPGADSPATCAEALIFAGGYFDVYGLAFDVTDGSNIYTVDMWSNGDNPALGGYQLNDSVQGSTTPFTPNQMSGLAYAVDVNASPTPEPGSLWMLGTGLSGVAVFWRRRKILA